MEDHGGLETREAIPDWMQVKIETVETDPLGKDPHTPGAKLDSGKRQLYTHLYSYFPRALDAVCEVSEFGARKYTRMGWATVPDGIERYTNALTRHLRDEAKGESVDRDSGLLHAAQGAWNALARLELMLKDRKEGLTEKGPVNTV